MSHGNDLLEVSTLPAIVATSESVNNIGPIKITMVVWYIL